MGNWFPFRCAVLLASIVAPASLASQAPTPLPRTRAEQTDFAETSRYADVVAFLDSLAALPGAGTVLHLTNMGYTYEGRPIPLAVVGRVPSAAPDAVRASGRTVVYVQANIHAGEVEGKEALLALLRDVVTGGHDPWLDSLVLLLVPAFNADGTERVSLVSRPLQNGPFGGTGQRANARGLDLNRDHTKLEAPETRSQVLLLRTYDPHVAVDLHTTNGSLHGYLVTYAEPLHPATDPAIAGLVRGQWLPAVSRAARQREGWHSFFYGNTPGEQVDRGGGGPEPGWYTFDHRPRFSENYWGLRNRFGILVEAYSYAAFRDRVRGTHRFLVETLDFAWANSSRLRALAAQADARNLVGDSLPVRARLHRGPEIEVLLGAAAERRHPYTGQRVLAQLPEQLPVRLRDFTTFEGAEYSRVPRAYLVPPQLGDVVELLAAHGVRGDTLAAPLTLAVERFRIDSSRTASREFQGHRERTVTGSWEGTVATVPAGTVVVPMSQPLARLVFLLLEPRSDDGVLNWNLMDEALEGARHYPLMRSFASF